MPQIDRKKWPRRADVNLRRSSIGPKFIRPRDGRVLATAADRRAGQLYYLIDLYGEKWRTRQDSNL